jgi:hypothetical protein
MKDAVSDDIWSASLSFSAGCPLDSRRISGCCKIRTKKTIVQIDEIYLFCDIFAKSIATGEIDKTSPLTDVQHVRSGWRRENLSDGRFRIGIQE